MAGDKDGASPPDATEAVDVRDVVRELSQLLDVRESGTDEVAAAVADIGDVATDEVTAPPDQTIAVEPITGPAFLDESDPELPARADPTMALQAIHLGEHENTGENDMEEEEEAATVARAPVVRAPRIGVLAWLPESALDALFELGTPRAVKKGDVISAEGASVERLTIVLEGRMRAVGNGQTVDVLRPGDVFGASMVTDGKFSASVDAVEPVRVLEVPLDAVKEWVATQNAGVHWLHQVAARRVHARILLSTRALAKVPRDRLAAAAESCTQRPVGDQSVLFALGDPAGSAYVVIEGRFRVQGADGKTVAPSAGEVLGLKSAASGAPRTSSVVAMTDAHVLEIPQAVLRSLGTTPTPAPTPEQSVTVPETNARPPEPVAPVRRARVNIPPLAEPSAPAPAVRPLAASDSGWSWLLDATAAHRAPFVAAIVFAFVAGAAIVVPALLTAVLIDTAIVEANRESFASLLGAMAVALAAAAVARSLSRTTAARTAGFAEVIFDDRLTDAVLRARPRGAFADLGETLERSRALVRDGTLAVGLGVLGAAQLLTATAAIATLDLRFLGLLIGVVVPSLLVCFVFGARVREAAEAEDRLGQRYDVHRRALLRARDTLVSTGRAAFLDGFRERAHRGQATANRAGAVAMGRSLLHVLGAVGSIAFVWLGGTLAIESNVTVGTFVAGALVLIIAIDAAQSVYTAWVTRSRIAAALPPVHDILAGEGGAVQPSEDRTNLRGLIRLTGVAVPAETSTPAVAVQALMIRAGEHVAFVGASDAGQDRLARAIAGVQPLASGDIVFDDTPLAALGAAAIAQRVAFVSGEPSIVHATVLENLTLTKTPHVERARAVASAVGLVDLIGGLPLGFETVIGGGGSMLAVGDERRLAIGRALYLDPPILVLAGTLDSFDAQTAEQLAEAIADVRRGRTTIVATVRPPLAARADRVVVFEAGEVVERGTPSHVFRGLS